MTFIAYVFPKLQTVEDLARPIFKKRSIRTSFNSQHVKRFPNTCEICMTALLSFCLSLWQKFSWKMSVLVIYEIFGLFFNILTEDEKYFL